MEKHEILEKIFFIKDLIKHLIEKNKEFCKFPKGTCISNELFSARGDPFFDFVKELKNLLKHLRSNLCEIDGI